MCKHNLFKHSRVNFQELVLVGFPHNFTFIAQYVVSNVSLQQHQWRKVWSELPKKTVIEPQ